MSTAMSDKPTAEVAACQGKVTDQVQHFVADALVGKSEFVVDRPILADYKHVLAGHTLTQSLGQEPIRFVLKNECPGRRNTPWAGELPRHGRRAAA